jgi:lipoprotein-anchoring transpeptidase ErfK/SrfK
LIALLLARDAVSSDAITPTQPAQSTDAVQSRRQIIVSIPDRQLALIEDGITLRVYLVAVGAPATPTPAGTFRVVNRLTDPTYYHPGVVIPPGSDNPLGNRWIGLDRKGYGIHGTNAPDSIGHAASQGCIRMAKADLEDLFDLVQPGDSVEVHAERSEHLTDLFGSSRAAAAISVPRDSPGSYRSQRLEQPWMLY